MPVGYAVARFATHVIGNHTTEALAQSETMTTHSLVTGGSGFLGGHLVERLLEAGERVRILDLKPPATDHRNLEFEQASILDTAAVERAVRGVRRVYHLAAIAGLWARDKRQFITVNQLGTRTVLAAAAAAGVERVVHCSTESILKAADHPGGLIDESVQPRLQDMPGPYCRGKLLAEQEAFAAAERGLDVVIVNPTVPLGPGDRFLTPPARMLLGFINGDHPAYLETALNLVDARDVAAGHLRAAEHGRPGERYVLGGENLQLSRLLELLGEITGLDMPRRRVPWWVARVFATCSELTADYITRRPPSAPLTGVRLAASPLHFDNRKAREQLGVTFRPIRETIIDAIADFQARGLLTRKPVRDIRAA